MMASQIARNRIDKTFRDVDAHRRDAKMGQPIRNWRRAICCRRQMPTSKTRAQNGITGLRSLRRDTRESPAGLGAPIEQRFRCLAEGTTLTGNTILYSSSRESQAREIRH